MENLVKNLSSTEAIPLNIVLLAINLTVLFVSFYWNRKATQIYNRWVEKELDKLWVEVEGVKESGNETKEQVISMANDIRWIRETLSKKQR